MSLSSRPYLLRALYDWMSENSLTPQILVDASQDGVEVPTAFVQNNQIILNIAMSATKDLVLADDYVQFSARFSGQPMRVFIPIKAIAAIFARESDVGMAFGSEPSLAGEADSRSSSKSASHLRTASESSADDVERDIEAGSEEKTDQRQSRDNRASDDTDNKPADSTENVIHVRFGRESEEGDDS